MLTSVLLLFSASRYREVTLGIPVESLLHHILPRYGRLGGRHSKFKRVGSATKPPYRKVIRRIGRIKISLFKPDESPDENRCPDIAGISPVIL